LRWLNLANCHFDNAGAEELATVVGEILPRLEELYLYNNTRLAPLDEATSGREAKTTVAPTPLEQVRNSTAKPCSTLDSLQSKRSHRQKSGVAMLVRALAPTLTRLSLSSCNLGNDVTIEVLTALAGRQALTSLDLSDNTLAESRTHGQLDFSPLMCSLIGKMPALRRLSLSLNMFGDVFAAALAYTLSHEVANLVVDLTANQVSGEVKEALMEEMRFQTSLRNVDAEGDAAGKAALNGNTSTSKYGIADGPLLMAGRLIV